MINIRALLLQAETLLKPQNDSSRLDAEILLAHCLKKTRAYLYTYPEKPLSPSQYQAFQALISQRAAGKPIAYLTGSREFWSLNLKVNEYTLIPRPETELLVELILAKKGHESKLNVLDLGTGAGSIALALAAERPNWQLTATDCSLKALEIARANAMHLGLTTVRFQQADWFAGLAIEQGFDLIVSNPPYIAANHPLLQQGDLRFEPSLALISGDDGLTAIKHIIKHSIPRLKPNGLLLLEHGFDQKLTIRSMLNRYKYTQVECWQDYQGLDRVSGGKVE